MRWKMPDSDGGSAGLLGILSPSSASTRRPSARETARTTARNSSMIGMPMMRIAMPSESEKPVTTIVK